MVHQIQRENTHFCSLCPSEMARIFGISQPEVVFTLKGNIHMYITYKRIFFNENFKHLLQPLPRQQQLEAIQRLLQQ